MYAIRKKYKRFVNLSYAYTCTITNQELMFWIGTLNYSWQYWNSFWRTYWLAYMLGGIDLKGSKISPINIPQNINKKEDAILFYLLFLLDKRKNYNGAITATYQEPTWGDRDNIEKIALKLTPIYSSFNNILNLLSIYGDTIKHFQLVRNATIHLDRDNINLLRSDVLPSYVVSDIKHPTDILFSQNMSTGKLGYISWMDELTAFLSTT